MADFFRRFLESVVYAGLKPGALKPPTNRWRWLGPFYAPLERFLSAPVNTDPLYLSNRTLGQKARQALWIAAPLAVLAGGAVLAYRVFGGREPLRPRELTPAEIAAKMLPNLDKPITPKGAPGLSVVEFHIDRSAGVNIVGTVKNNAAHEVHEAEVVFDLTDQGGSQVGAVSVKLPNLAAGASARFSAPVSQQSAVSAWVREVRSQ
ncbi:MAG TPA: FxLYD domain-containing protein [Bryobacteraceae bacterium]|nr:FxLYD domain-containing protein [Bryobacteraceae bacterium]